MGRALTTVVIPNCGPSPIHLPAALRSTPITALQHYYGGSDSCRAGSSAVTSMNTALTARQASLLHVQRLRVRSVSNHLACPQGRFSTIRHSRALWPKRIHGCARTCTPTFQRLRFVPGFAIHQQARRTCQAVSSSSSYGPDLHLPLLPTPPHGGAVTVDYRIVTSFRGGLTPP